MSDWDEMLDPRNPSPVSEEFDQTWPFNFKWAYNAETGETDIWRVQGGTDGRPTHRAEVQTRWGRPARVQDGDTLGLATYIPAEKKYDGTVMAPAEVRLQTYYNMPTPPSVTEWFQKNFPGASIREAVISPSKTQIFGKKKMAEWDPTPYEPEDPIYKWIWNPEKGLLIWETEGVDGEPYHDMKCLNEWGRMCSAGSWGDGDFLGYAFIDVPGHGAITTESYDASPVPTQAFAAVKQQLAQWYPQYQIINGNASEKHEFGGTPGDFHGAAVKWAWEHLSQTAPGQAQNDSDAPVGVWGGLTRLFQKKPVWEKTADADMEGCMVALFVPEEAGNKLKIRGGEPVENMHITLLYFADKADERDDWDEVRKLVEQIANQSPPMTGKVSGYGVFGSDEGDVLWASPSVVGLAELRHKLYEACEDAGFHVNEEHDWAPHITLKYDHKGKLPKTSDEIELEFTELSFAQGDDHDDFKMKGHLEKTTSNSFQPGDLVARAQDPEGKWIKPAYGEVKRVYRDPINREWSAVVRWDYPENPDGFVETALPFSNIVPFQHQMGLDLRTASAPTEPPNYRKHEKPDEACKLCKMMWKGECWGYGNKPVEPDMVCDSFSPETVKTSAEDYLDWGGWDGAHRFVTDGKEIHTAPETGQIDSTQWMPDPEMVERFRTIYPDAKGFAGGWTIPTADKMGVGIYAPAAGYGDQHEPGLHDIIKVVEEQFGKPAHLITNPDHLSDEKMYTPSVETGWQEL